MLKHPLCTFETDALVSAKGSANPGSYGTFPRVIQQCHKELNLFPLEDAIARMTGKSAERIGLKDRGLIKSGYAADLTLFDYEEIKDNTTVYETRQRPDGIRHVFLNGVEVVTQGRARSVRPGGQGFAPILITSHPQIVIWPNLCVRSKKPILKICHIFLRLAFYFLLDLGPYSVFWDDLYFLSIRRVDSPGIEAYFLTGHRYLVLLGLCA